MNATLEAKHGPDGFGAASTAEQGTDDPAGPETRRQMREPSEMGSRVYLRPPHGDDADEFLPSCAGQQEPCTIHGSHHRR